VRGAEQALMPARHPKKGAPCAVTRVGKPEEKKPDRGVTAQGTRRGLAVRLRVASAPWLVHRARRHDQVRSDRREEVTASARRSMTASPRRWDGVYRDLVPKCNLAHHDPLLFASVKW